MGTKALSDYMIEGALHTGSVGRVIGELMPLERYETISSTFPWKNLADADAELDEANFPDYVPVMRDVKVYKYQGGPGWFIPSFTIVSNVVTVTFFNVDYYIDMINSLAEMLLDYTNGITPTPTDYTNLNLCLNLIGPIGVIPAGDYTITNINPSARQMQFSYVHSDTSGSTGYSVDIYPYRVPGDSTKCRHRQQLGKAIMTPDFETFFNGVSWRDHFQGHEILLQYSNAAGSATTTWARGNTENTGNYQSSSGRGGTNLGIVGDATNGDPRTDSQTYPSGLGAFLYRYVGRYVAP